MSDFSQYQTDNLFLLIGSNPLPNYVASKLLAHDQTKIYLIHTTETEGKIQQLENSLCRPVPSERIKVDNADAENIFSQVKRFASQCQGSIGLNYTGGTKAMAVHAYRAIQEATNGETIASYLDAKTLQLLIDREGQRSLSYPVGLEVELSIEELLQLHGYRLNKPITYTPIELDLAQIVSNIPGQKFGDWCYQNLKKEKKPDKRDFKSKTELREVVIPSDDIFAPLRTYQGNNYSVGELEAKTSLKVDKLAQFLDGLWLEHYVLDAIQQVKEECQIKECGLSVEPIGIREFEIDVVAIRGYQLFAIACTTQFKKADIKLKLFEAYTRANQIGGNEAKIALVCRASQSDTENNPIAIQQELEEIWEEAKGKIRVFGEEHLPRLPEYLKQWFTYNARR